MNLKPFEVGMESDVYGVARDGNLNGRPVLVICEITGYDQEKKLFKVNALYDNNIYEAVIPEERLFHTQEDAEKYILKLKLGGKN